MSYSFNLLERPWIPCLTRQGIAVPLSLRETLARAHELLNITHESPLVGVSVMRLLLAVLHRVYGPRNAAAWAILWRSPSFDMAALDGYFDQWRGRFDLFGAEQPFYQDASIPRCLAGPVSKLVHSSASGNNATLFDHSLDDDCSAITALEAALQLVAHQTYAVGGTATPDPSVAKSKHTEGSPTVKGVLCMVRGDSLRQTLLLNLRRYHPTQEVPFGGAQDIPAWERVKSAQVRERIPCGWLDLLTWQSRRILLFPEGDTVAPEVRNAAVMKGEAVSNSFALPEKDSMMAWQRLPKARKGASPWIPLSFREERAVWRDAHSLFGKFEDQSVRPPILDWIGDLTDEVLDEAHPYALDVAGLCTSRAKVLSWHAESLPLPLTILKQPALCAQVKKALEMAENGERALQSGTKRLAERLLTHQDRVGGEKKDSDKNAVSRLACSLFRLQHYWAGIQIEFQKFIVDLAAGGRDSIDVDTGLTEALAEWIRQCRRSAKRSMDLTFRAVGHGDRTFRAVAEAESSFIGTLNQKLPDPEVRKEVVENDTAIAG
ncbi:MAG: type I-E CRISPR-associated protein Cse1/CasA [Acidobacteriia bacterium]|nr:type I-E CRISPR-associated protein Cse1/CasA [Terriglobia bacterium]